MQHLAICYLALAAGRSAEAVIDTIADDREAGVDGDAGA